MQTIFDLQEFRAWHDESRDRYYANPGKSSAIHSTRIRCTHAFDLRPGRSVGMPKVVADTVAELRIGFKETYGVIPRDCRDCMP